MSLIRAVVRYAECPYILEVRKFPVKLTTSRNVPVKGTLWHYGSSLSDATPTSVFSNFPSFQLIIMIISAVTMRYVGTICQSKGWIHVANNCPSCNWLPKLQPSQCINTKTIELNNAIQDTWMITEWANGPTQIKTKQIILSVSVKSNKTKETWVGLL